MPTSIKPNPSEPNIWKYSAFLSKPPAIPILFLKNKFPKTTPLEFESC